MGINPLLGVAIALGGQLAFLAACSEIPTDSPSYRPCERTYGAEGAVTADELRIVQWLAWPQTYADMVGALGYPAHRTGWADFYQIEDTNQWLVIFYDGKVATTFKVSQNDLECSP